jgi:hypothetical protein
MKYSTPFYRPKQESIHIIEESEAALYKLADYAEKYFQVHRTGTFKKKLVDVKKLLSHSKVQSLNTFSYIWTDSIISEITFSILACSSCRNCQTSHRNTYQYRIISSYYMLTSISNRNTFIYLRESPC